MLWLRSEQDTAVRSWRESCDHLPLLESPRCRDISSVVSLLFDYRFLNVSWFQYDRLGMECNKKKDQLEDSHNSLSYNKLGGGSWRPRPSR